MKHFHYVCKICTHISSRPLAAFPNNYGFPHNPTRNFLGVLQFFFWQKQERVTRRKIPSYDFSVHRVQSVYVFWLLIYIFSPLHSSYSHIHTQHVYMKYVRSSQRSMKCRWKKCVLYWKREEREKEEADGWVKNEENFRCFSVDVPCQPLMENSTEYSLCGCCCWLYSQPSPSLTLSLPFVHPHVKFSIFSRFLYFIIICFPPFPFSTGCSLYDCMSMSWRNVLCSTLLSCLSLPSNHTSRK